MTICDTIADVHYGSRPEMAMAFAALLNEEALELEALGVDLASLPVDFDSQDLILVALGVRPTEGYRVRIDDVYQVGNRLVVRATAVRPSANAVTLQVLTHPAALIAMPKSGTDLEIVVESIEAS